MASLLPVSTEEFGGNWILRRRGKSGISRSPILTKTVELGVAIASKQNLSLGCRAVSTVGNSDSLTNPKSFGGRVMRDSLKTLTLI